MTDQQIYLKQIKRLQEKNVLLAECLCEERQLRKGAYNWYQNRLKSKLSWITDYLYFSMTGRL